MAYKGYFTPSDPSKYIGNWKKIFFRSLWERKIMIWCDTSDNVLEWGSEEITIPYKCPTDRKFHRYYPDFYIKIINNGEIKTQIVEVKPKKQTNPPTRGRKKRRTYLIESKAWAKNQAKWKAAVEFCKDRKWEFHIITENHPLLKAYNKNVK